MVHALWLLCGQMFDLRAVALNRQISMNLCLKMTRHALGKLACAGVPCGRVTACKAACSPLRSLSLVVLFSFTLAGPGLPDVTWVQPLDYLAFPPIDDASTALSPLHDGYSAIGGVDSPTSPSWLAAVPTPPGHWDVIQKAVLDTDFFGPPLLTTKLLSFRDMLMLVGVFAFCPGTRPRACLQ